VNPSKRFDNKAEPAGSTQKRRRTLNRPLSFRFDGWRAARRYAGGRTALVIGVAVCVMAAAGLASAASKKSPVVLTEVDYYNALPNSLALPPLLKKCGDANGVVVKRQLIPQANLVPKLLQDVSTHSFPNLALIDNPNVQQLAATGALAPLSGIKIKGLFPSVISAGSYKGKSYGVAAGVNDLGLYYNKDMFAKAGLQPPKTWAELKSDAKALTSGTTYGFAFSAPNEEEATWQFEPFFWSNGGSLLKVNSPAVVDALTFVQGLVTDGSASKSVVTWTQGDVADQFTAGHAAMMENGPWELPVLSKVAGLNFGAVPFPTPKAGGKPVSPLGGEMWAVGKTGGVKQAKATAVLQCLLSAKQSLAWSNKVGYMSTNVATAKSQAAKNPQLSAFVSEVSTARARTTELGPKYNQVSQAIWTAIQSVISGGKSPQDALNTAQQSVGG
jgi:multiple sugar transport system substrate-binding protein